LTRARNLIVQKLRKFFSGFDWNTRKSQKRFKKLQSGQFLFEDLVLLLKNASIFQQI